MEKRIAYCGLDCGQCDARRATVNDDRALREATAALWSELNHTEILPDQIDCLGCRAEGVKTLLLGDCGADEQSGLLNCYKASTLKSDVLQVAHHGINGCDSNLYNSVAASYAMIPVGADKIIVDGTKIDSILGKSINQYVKNLSATPNRVFLAGGTVAVLKFAGGTVNASLYNNMDTFLQTA